MTMILPIISPERTYVALATLLPSGLRAHASTANLCFFQVVDHATDAERLFVRVTALPHRLTDLDSSRVFPVCLCVEQIAQALPWDQTMQARPTCDVRELVELHARQVGGGIPPVQDGAPTHPLVPTRRQEGKDIELVAFPEVFVSCETVQEVVAETPVPHGAIPPSKQRRWMQVTGLRAGITMLRRQLSYVTQLQGHLHALLATLDHAIRCAYVAQHRVRHPLVCASPVFIEGQHVGWHLHVGVPILAA